MQEIEDILVDMKIADAKKFQIYTGREKDKPVIIKVAKTFEDGIMLQQEAAKLTQISAFAKHVDNLQDETCGESARYGSLIAHLEHSFLDTELDRRTNIISFSDADLNKLTPLAKLYNLTDIDTRTSVWVLGKIFKFYSLFELMAVENNTHIKQYPLFTLNDYLVGPERHNVVYYNYSGYSEDCIATNFVKAIARTIRKWIVNKLEDDDKGIKYLELVDDFASNGRITFELAHSDLYNLVESLWGIEYHPFTYRNKGAIIFKTALEE